MLALPITIIHTPKVAVGQSRCKKQLVVSRTACITETVKWPQLIRLPPKTTSCFLKPIWTNPRRWCTTTTRIYSQLVSWLVNPSVWVTHQFRDSAWIMVWSSDRKLYARSTKLAALSRWLTIPFDRLIIPERQANRFGSQLRIAKLQINKLALSK